MKNFARKTFNKVTNWTCYIGLVSFVLFYINMYYGDGSKDVYYLISDMTNTAFTVSVLIGVPSWVLYIFIKYILRKDIDD